MICVIRIYDRYQEWGLSGLNFQILHTIPTAMRLGLINSFPTPHYLTVIKALNL